MNQGDENGKRHGDWVLFYSRFSKSGPVKSEEGKYVNGEREGVWKAYYFNGKMKALTTYANGKPIGRMVSYYEDGQVREEGHWHIDHWKGKYMYYYPNGQVMYDWTYDQKGRKHGGQLAFHESGKLMSRDFFKDGVREGYLFEYAEDGTLLRQTMFSAGDRGKAERPASKAHNYLADGTPADIIPNGEHSVYDKDRKLLEQGVFADGALQSGEQFIYSGKDLFRVATVSGGRVTATREPTPSDRTRVSNKQ
jgi:antitoxin component YwqK of YwqJK toxin-antitoxin module